MPPLKTAIACSIAVAALLANLSSSGSAAEPDPRFTDFLRSKETREAVAKGVRQQVLAQPVECKDIKVAGDSKFRMVSPVEFSGEGKVPAKGSWIETMTVDACGVVRSHNIQSAVIDGKVQMIGRLNGSSVANLTLQRDAVKIAVTAAVPQAGGACEKTAIIDTAFKGFEGEPIADAKDGPKSRLWREEWTVWACGKEIALPMVFTPDKTGTAIAADASGAKIK